MKTQMKKILALVLALALTLGLLPFSAVAAEEAIEISSLDQITDMSGNYLLTADATVTAPIGTFSGIFDGGGHTITVNLTATGSNTGMFSTIASGAEVKNFKIANSSVTSSSYDACGLVAGTNNGTVSDITVENSTVNGYTNVGGLVGSNTGTVTRCAFESGTVKKGSSSDTGFGGIVGQNNGTVSLCSNGATMDHSSGRSNYDYTGGIVGRNQYNGKVSDCYNFGTLDDGANKSYRIGGVVGDNSGSVTNCLNVGTISTSAYSLNAVASSATNSYYLQGCGATSGGTAKTAEELASLAATLGENWVDGSDGYPVLTWQTWKYSNTAIKYTVEYYTETLEEGIYELSSSSEVKAEPDTPVTAEAVSIEGFTFDESNENNILSGAASAELVLKCYYSRNSYTLSWDVGEGTITSEEGAYTAGSVKYGAAVTYPEVSNPGYTVSWSETITTMPAADTTVTANWNTALYPVTWDANGGQFETEDSWGDVTTSATLTWGSNAGSSCGAIYGQTLGKYRWSETSTTYSNRSLPAPVHDTMVFGGWYTAAEGGELVDKDTVVTIPETGSFTYYAHWEEAWTVTFDTNGGYTSNDKTVLVGKGMTYGTAGSIPTATKTGHSLSGWFDADGNQLTADTVINGDVTYTAQWTPNTYTVTFYPNGGTGSMEPQTFTYGVAQNISKNMFTREGYRFVGWATWSSASSASYTDEQEYTIGSYNQSFYAIWEEVRYNLTLNVNPEDAEVVLKNASGVTQTATDGVYNLQEGIYTYTITKYGYETVEESVELTSDTVLNIELVKIPSYTVSFNVTKPAESGETVITVTSADGMEMTASEDGTYDLIPGTYSYLITAHGCTKAKAEFTVTDSDLSFDIELLVSYAWDGSTKTEPKTITAEEATGDYEGMEGWYLITSGEELAWFADQINTTSSGYSGNAVLAKDIDLGEEVWSPMGYSWNYYFNGTFDGNGHAIRGLYCNGADYQALFGYSKGTIKNLTVYGEVNGTGSYVGGIVAYQNGGSILNCGSYINVTSTNTTGRNAGIAGYLYGTTVDGCFNAGTITGSKYQAGIAGYVYGTTNITNCYNVGALVAGEVSESSGSYACSAGIFAYTSDYATVTVENCYNAGDLSNGNTRIGAIAGEVGEATTITNSYYLDDVSKSVAYGSPASDASVAKTADELKSAEILTALGAAYKADGADAQSINNGYPVLAWQILPEVSQEPEYVLDENLNFTMSITVGAEMQVVYTVMNDRVSSFESFYLEVSKNVAGSDPKVTVYGLGEDMTAMEIISNPSTGATMGYRVTYTGINAKEMGDDFTTTLYAVASDGTIHYSNATTSSIKSFLMGKLEDSSSSAELKTLAVDMLNYGAAAQINFGYDTENLVNADLTADQLALGTQGTPEATNEITITGDGVNVSASVTLQSKVVLYLTCMYQSSETSSLKFVIKDAATGEVLAEMDPTRVMATGCQGMYDAVGAKQMRDLITIELYDNGELVSKTLTWSVESYVAQTRDAETTSDVLRNMVNAMLIYGDAVAAYMTASGQG